MLLLLIRWVDELILFPLRRRYLTKRLSPYLSDGQSVLDLGASDGRMVHAIQRKLPSLVVTGADVYPQPKTSIPIVQYDGRKLPFADKSFDVVMLIDVLHHDSTPVAVLKEARRVTRRFILVKDHYWKSKLDHLVLCISDYIGNKPYGVRLPYNYLQMAQWRALFKDQKLGVSKMEQYGATLADPCRHVVFLLD